MKRIIRGINKRRIITTSIIVLIFVMSLGYAALSQHMDLDGIATIDRSWIVKIKSMNCTTTGTAKVDSTNFISNTAVINGTLGDSSSKITCTIVLENQGNLKAKLGNVEVIEDDNKLITYSYTGVSEGTQLNPGESNTATVTINYASGVTNIENTKKSVMLTFVYLENEPNTSNNPSPVPTSYEEYKVGDEVILLDGSKWTVTKDSGKGENLVTLLSLEHINAQGDFTTVSSEIYSVPFANGSTANGVEYNIYESGNVGYFIQNTFLPKIKESLTKAGGVATYTEARLVTYEEVNALKGKGSTSPNADGAYGYYWTMTKCSSSTGIYYFTQDYSTTCDSAITRYSYEVKPVIITEKSNIKRPPFETDSWDTIVENMNTDRYNVGDTREVTLKGFGTFTLRIANTTTPDVCKDIANFSQTACGFVVEFADVITEHVMNSNATNSGGWEESEMREYVNKDIYEALPEDLKAVIIDTNVISGHGSGDTNNFKTKDKLYLLSPHEVWAQGIGTNDEAYDLTRQLDYYEKNNVSINNYSGAIKKFNGSASEWWVRAAHSSYTEFFTSVADRGYWGNGYADYARGVSPAFRIGKKSPFETDSWDTIVENMNTNRYNVGDTRKVTLEGFGTFTLRIANKSTPDVCKDTENFSQTACGFVIEFEDIITTHVMNSSQTNSGGWEKSEIREYVNKNIYEALPDDLKAVIIETNVISGQEYGVSANYKTKDKLYLLSTHEVWAQGSSKKIISDTAYDLTRQLDYYANLGVTTSSYSWAKKNGNGSAPPSWWLRAAYSSYSSNSFYLVSIDGAWSWASSTTTVYGVSPAFRIG